MQSKQNIRRSMRFIVMTLALLTFTSNLVNGQHFKAVTITGTLIDSSSRQPIEAATVFVYLSDTSSIISFAITNTSGQFTIREIPAEHTCKIRISYGGREIYSTKLILSGLRPDTTLPTIYLKRTYRELNEVTVTARRPPIIYKKDTIEFDTRYIFTSPNSVLEELLKELPGVEVDQLGNITVNGKKITKITIDGKDYFKEDFKIVSRNLPRELIEKIQVTELKSKISQFSGLADPDNDKSINIILKNKRTRQVFGQVGIGIGSNNRNDWGTTLNYKSDKVFVNVLQNANNINRSSTASEGILLGKIGTTEHTGEGIQKSKIAALNLAYHWGKSNHFYTNLSNTNVQEDISIESIRENYYTDTVVRYDLRSKSNSENESSRLVTGAELQPDSLSTITIRGIFTWRKSMNIKKGNVSASSDAQGPISQIGNLFTKSDNLNGKQLEFFAGKMLNTQGRSLTVTVAVGKTIRDGFELNNGLSTFFLEGVTRSQDSVDLSSGLLSKEFQVNLQSTYTEPISDKLQFVFGYNYSRTFGESKKNTNRYNEQTNAYDIVDSSFTNSFKYNFDIHSPSWMINYKSKKVQATVGPSFQISRQKYETTFPKSYLTRDYINLLPILRVNYIPNKQTILSFTYQRSIEQPTVEQLHPVPNNSDMFNIKVGNPDLKPSHLNNIALDFTSLNSKGMWRIGLTLQSSKRQIVEQVTFDSLQTSKWINTKGGYSASLALGFNHIWIRQNSTVRLSTPNEITIQRLIAISDGNILFSTTYDWAQKIKLTYSIRQLFTISPELTIRYTTNHYHQNPTAITNNINSNIKARLMLRWPEHFLIDNNFDFTQNNNSIVREARRFIIWNTSISYNIGRHELITLKIGVFDLLNRNIDIRQYRSAIYFEDSRSTTLQRYFFASFIYTIKPKQ